MECEAAEEAARREDVQRWEENLSRTGGALANAGPEDLDLATALIEWVAAVGFHPAEILADDPPSALAAEGARYILSLAVDGAGPEQLAAQIREARSALGPYDRFGSIPLDHTEEGLRAWLMGLPGAIDSWLLSVRHHAFMEAWSGGGEAPPAEPLDRPESDPEAGVAQVTAGSSATGEPLPDLTLTERNIIQALEEAGSRMTGPMLWQRAMGTAEPNKALLSSMKKRELIDNGADARGKGYGLPKWASAPPTH